MEHRSPKNDVAASEQSFDWPPDDLANIDELIEAARDYFAKDFPNPERRGCPVSGELPSIVDSGQRPTPELRAHLFGCSECFSEYREAVLRQRQPAVAPTVIWGRDLVIALLRWRAPLLAGAIVLLALGIGMIIWSSREEPAPQISQSRPQPASSGDVERKAQTGTDLSTSDRVTPRAQPMLTPTAPKIGGQRSMPADLLVININLNDYSSLEEPRRRDFGGKEEKVIELPRTRIRMELTLPPASDPGRYQISIVDTFFRLVTSGKAISNDGNRLTIDLNLSRLPQRDYRLSLSHGDSAPYFYRVVIFTR